MSLANGTCDCCGKKAEVLHCTMEDWEKAEGSWILVGTPPPSVPQYCDACRELVEQEYVSSQDHSSDT
jgi:hypothetical protein